MPTARPSRSRAGAPLDHASLLIAAALVADALTGQHRPWVWIAAPAYVAAVVLLAWSRSRLVEPLAVSGVLLPLALGDVTARSIASASVQAAILVAVLLVRRQTRIHYRADLTPTTGDRRRPRSLRARWSAPPPTGPRRSR